MAVKWCAHLWLYHRIVYIGIGTCSGKIAVKDNHTFKVPTGVKVVNAIIGGPSGLFGSPPQYGGLPCKQRTWRASCILPEAGHFSLHHQGFLYSCYMILTAESGEDRYWQFKYTITQEVNRFANTDLSYPCSCYGCRKLI